MSEVDVQSVFYHEAFSYSNWISKSFSINRIWCYLTRRDGRQKLCEFTHPAKPNWS